MTPQLSICMPFYTNSGMLALHYQAWATYPEALRAKVEIVLVDDGSPDAAVDVPRPVGLPTLRIYRVLEDRPWHQHGARNLAAHQAAAPWLFMTDMDHLLPASCLAQLLEQLDRDVVYTFHRLDAPTLTPKLLHGRPHPHQNTFAVRKARYWQAGGYDEDFCGFYGTDGYFLQRLYRGTSVVHLDAVHVVRYPREVVPDASTRADREAGRRMADRAAVRNQKTPGAPIPVLQFPWEQVL